MVARAPDRAEMEPCGPFGRAWRVTKGGWVTGDRDTDELEVFLAVRGDELLRTAVLLAGGRESGEDLLQTAVERLLVRWHRFDGDPEGYLRRTMANLATDRYRRHRRWQLKARLLRADAQPPRDATAEVDLRDALVRILLRLPARQRAVLVLRYWEQLDEAETARVLGWPEGTVKSATSRGLKRLRQLAQTWPETGARPELLEKRS
jgi:RNA polymerase sigma-70 factor (sigma-E family)